MQMWLAIYSDYIPKIERKVRIEQTTSFEHMNCVVVFGIASGFYHLFVFLFFFAD